MSMYIFLAAGAVALFTFLAVTTWSENRTKERTVYYQQETYKKLAEASPERTELILETIRRERQSAYQKMLEGVKLGGLITALVGVGVAVMLWVLAGVKVAVIGVVPFLVGVAMLVYVFLMAPRKLDELNEAERER